jgi:FkbH-like protein
MQFEWKEFNQLRKSAKRQLTGSKQIRIAILADFSSQLLIHAIKGYGVEDNISYDIFEADYNQAEQQVFDADSELYAFKPDWVFIFNSSEHLVQNFYKASNAQKLQFADDRSNHFAALYQAIKSRLTCRVVFNNHIEVNDGVFGNYALKTQLSALYQVKKLNLLMAELSQQQADLFILDIASLTSTQGYKHVLDNKLYYSADMVYYIDFLPHVAREVNNLVAAGSGSFKKCVIVDLDNTLWGGIIGDDGLEGIQIGELGTGKIFSDLQLWLKQLKQRGILIVVCSKNTDHIAREPFLSHPAMVLRLDDIALFVANWETKADNINHIQQVLNIGFDAMVFIDDNPFEREHIKFAIPEVTVPSLPEDPADYLSYLKSLNLFETTSFVAADEQRTQQYQESARRVTEQATFHNADDYLRSLNMLSVVGHLDAFNIPRVAQLSQRSNQFNLRTVRYTEEQLRHIASSPNYLSFTFTLKDKYGDNGLIAFVILKVQNSKELFIENWAMSCRVLKRGMEQFTLLNIIDQAVKNSFTRINAEFVPTAKNSLVKDHYTNLGFNLSEPNKFYLDLPVKNFHYGQIHIQNINE